jgi:virginiamycin B lyase
MIRVNKIKRKTNGMLLIIWKIVKFIGSKGSVLTILIFCGSSAYSNQLGLITEFDLPGKAGSTHEITVGPKGNLWVSQQKPSRLVRLTTDGLATVFDLPKGSGPHGMAWDHFNRLWVTFEFTDEIAQLNENGILVQKFPIPLKNAHPHGLTIGQDGNIWWTGKRGNVVGRLNPETRKFDIFSLGSESGTPIYISPGPHGNLWFTELTGNHIGRVTPSGIVTRFKIPFENSRPIVVFTGPNKRVWFTEERGNSYGQVSQDGKFTRFGTGIKNGKLAGAAFDLGQNLWVQFNYPDIIQRITPNGEVATYSLPTKNAVQHRIILGPDGNMWFTELKSDKVGRIITATGN